jgi:hypothetical protein
MSTNSILSGASKKTLSPVEATVIIESGLPVAERTERIERTECSEVRLFTITLC